MEHAQRRGDKIKKYLIIPPHLEIRFFSWSLAGIQQLMNIWRGGKTPVILYGGSGAESTANPTAKMTAEAMETTTAEAMETTANPTAKMTAEAMETTTAHTASHYTLRSYNNIHERSEYFM